jgi:5'-nucleotidase
VGHVFKRTVGGVSACAVAAGLAVGLPTAAGAVVVPEGTEINLLNINDFHGRIEPVNTVLFAGTVEQLRAEHPDSTLFLSAGDNIGASLFASATQEDVPTIDVLDALELAASAVGNHEFDRGFEDLSGRVDDEADFAYLGANVYLEGTQTAAMEEYTTFDVGDVTVGVIGAVTEETPSLVTPGGIATLDFGDPVEAVNRVAAQLSDGNAENGEADVIVAEYHEGAASGDATLEEQIVDGGAFADIVTQTSADVDAIFTGHTHQAYVFEGQIPGEEGTRPIVQTGSYGANIGQIVLTVGPEGEVLGYEARNVSRLQGEDEEDDADEEALADELVAQYPRVAAVDEIVDAALAVAEEIGSQVVGEATAHITTAFTGGAYTGEGGTYEVPDADRADLRDDRGSASTLGTLVANALRDVEAPAAGTAEIGVVNPGGLRNEFYVDENGDITYAEANAVLPFVNNVWFTTLTGSQFITLLNQQWQRTAGGDVPSRPYLQLGLSDNVSYVADPSLPEGQRIISVTVDGEPLDLDAEYRISSFSFLVQGGDNFRVFTEGTNTVDTGLIDREVWIDYITETSPLTPDFTKRFLYVDGLSTTEVIAVPGQTIDFEVSNVDLTSLGAPLNTAVTVSLGEEEVGTFALNDGMADVSFTIPADFPVEMGEVAAVAVTISAAPTGTEVPLWMLVLPAEFPDVTEDNEFADEISWLLVNGITTGYLDGTYRPTWPVSRQAMAAFLYRMANGGEDAPACSEGAFPDVPADAPFCGEITWMMDQGLTTGYEDGTFRPTAPVSRQATAAFLYRLQSEDEAPDCTERPFTDVAVTDAFCGEIQWLRDAGILNGYSDDTFRATSPVTRQAMAAFLYRSQEEAD